MARVDDAFAAHQRRRFMRPDAHRYIRPDAWRFMPPGAPRYLGKEAVRYFWPEYEGDRPSQSTGGIDPAALEAERTYLLKLQSELAALKAEIKFRKLLRALKAYNPDQPRVPAGNSDGGQWTSDGNSTGERRIRLAGDIPTNEPPEVPKERPPTERQRNRVARDVSRNPRLKGVLGLILNGAVHWLQEKFPEIVSDQDPPKTLDELQDAVSTPKKGYDIHHIVEQGPARKDGFSEEVINGRDNLVQIPRFQHWRINEWFATKNDDFGGVPPRDHLRGKDWEERRRVGLDALAEFGVLKR